MALRNGFAARRRTQQWRTPVGGWRKTQTAQGLISGRTEILEAAYMGKEKERRTRSERAWLQASTRWKPSQTRSAGLTLVADRHELWREREASPAPMRFTWKRGGPSTLRVEATAPLPRFSSYAAGMSRRPEADVRSNRSCEEANRVSRSASGTEGVRGSGMPSWVWLPPPCKR